MGPERAIGATGEWKPGAVGAHHGAQGGTKVLPISHRETLCIIARTKKDD